MKVLLIALALVSTVSQAAPKATPKAPACWNESESCTAQWFEYGDATGDYGVIDAAN